MARLESRSIYGFEYIFVERERERVQREQRSELQTPERQIPERAQSDQRGQVC